jgi:cytochrome c oxidase subunit 2
MGGYVYVMEPASYQQWLAGGAGSESAASQGQKLFQERGCASCHQTDPGGQQGRGPTLYGLFGKPQAVEGGQEVTVDEAYIRESILNPRAHIAAGFDDLMPTFQGQLSEEQILQLVAYIRSLGPAEQGAAEAGSAPGTTTTGPTTGGVPPQQQRMNPIGPTSERRGSPAPQAAPAGGGNTGNANRQ